MTTEFEIVEKNVEDIKILKVIGELDALVAPKLKEKIAKLLESDTKKIVIDFEQLSHINSLAMGILRNKLKTAKENGGDIKLVKLNSHIKDIFEMIGLDEIFEIYQTEAEAIQKFSKK
ncbi:MAG: STAS domain-containing protein [Fusobacteriaceae bacterium]